MNIYLHNQPRKSDCGARHPPGVSLHPHDGTLAIRILISPPFSASQWVVSIEADTVQVDIFRFNIHPLVLMPGKKFCRAMILHRYVFTLEFVALDA